jgi:hypothetical protein
MKDKMKNIHILPTDKPSRLYLGNNGNFVFGMSQTAIQSRNDDFTNQKIYITSDEELVLGGYHFNSKYGDEPQKTNQRDIDSRKYWEEEDYYISKIILTTDQDLIKDGVQAIDDEFLEWFVKNPSCEEIYVNKIESFDFETDKYVYNYKIIISQEEPKQLFTDHPITELGDKEFVEAPIRECELISYDDNKYCYVKVEGIEKEIKRCYIYSQRGRCGEVDCISVDEIKELLKEEPKKVLTDEDIFNQKDIDAVTDYINKEQQKQALIDMIKSDEELGLYDETIDSIKLEEVFGSKHCLYSVIENKLAILYRNQEKILSAIKILNNGRK